MKFAKLESGSLVPCPKVGKINGTLHSNLWRLFEDNLDLAKENGWKILVEKQKPVGNYLAYYTEDEHRIYQHWKEIKPEPDFDMERQCKQNAFNIEFLAEVFDLPINKDGDRNDA